MASDFAEVAEVADAEVAAEPPAWASASLTAVRIALEVRVAPETPSTPSVPLASTISDGSCSMAFVPMPWVSELSPTVTSVILPPETVTVTGTSPALPCADAS